jgi:hypothetical protein
VSQAASMEMEGLIRRFRNFRITQEPRRHYITFSFPKHRIECIVSMSGHAPNMPLQLYSPLKPPTYDMKLCHRRFGKILLIGPKQISETYEFLEGFFSGGDKIGRNIPSHLIAEFLSLVGEAENKTMMRWWMQKAE